MKMIAALFFLILVLPLNAEDSSPHAVAVAAKEAQEVSMIDVPLDQRTDQDEDTPKHVSKVSKRTSKAQRSRQVLDLVLAGVVAVGTFVCILLL